jgi:hypothetical protein
VPEASHPAYRLLAPGDVGTRAQALLVEFGRDLRVGLVLLEAADVDGSEDPTDFDGRVERRPEEGKKTPPVASSDRGRGGASESGAQARLRAFLRGEEPDGGGALG